MALQYIKLEGMADIPAPAGTATPRVQHATEDGITLAYGTTVPADATAGYAPGCTFIHVDGGAATALYVNEGTVTSSDFNAIQTSANLGALTELTMGDTAYTLPSTDGSNGQQLTTDGSGALTWAAAGGTFAGGNITSDITLNADGVDIQADTTTAHTYAIKVYDVDNTTYRDALRWTNGDTVAIVLGNTSGTLAISSTGLNVSAAGAVTGVTTLSASSTVTAAAIDATGSGGITLENDGTIKNAVDSEFTFADAGEDFTIDMNAGTNIIGFKSSTGIAGIDFGDVDALSGIGSIAFDAAAASITTTTDGDAQDLTVGITGATNSSLILTSSGTAADAVQITASAGGIDITANGAAANEDIDITTSASVNVTATENAANAVKLLANGGANETVVVQSAQGTGESSVTIVSTAGGVDIDAAAAKNITLDGGQVLITGLDDAANAIKLYTNTGTSETLVVTNNAGTGNSALTLSSTAGGVDIDAAAAKPVAIDGGSIALTTKTAGASCVSVTANQGAADTIVVTNTQGTGEGGITLTSTAGGVDVDAAAGKNIALDGGQVLIASKDDVASAIALTANVGTSETIVVTNTKGTGAGAITLASTAGGVDVDAAAAKPVAIAGGSVTIDSKTAGAGAVAVTVAQGAADTITVTNTQGTDAAAVALTATAGGITLSSSSGTTITGSVIRTGQQYVQTISYCKVGSTAGWVVPAAADAAHVVTLPQSQTASTLVIPIMVPLKVGWTITAWTLNGQIDSAGNGVTLDAQLFKHTEAEAGFTNANVGDAMTQVSKTADYKVVDGKSGLSEVVAADESYYLLLTGTTGATCDIEIAGITVTVSET